MSGRADRGRISVGRRGEEAACAYLAERGYRILDRNWRCRLGEIDIVAEQGGIIVFVEVRTRTGSRFGTGAESVGMRKQRRLRAVSAAYLAWHGWSMREVRFDVIAIEADPAAETLVVEHIAGAF